MSARDALARRLARRLAIGAPLAWLALFFVAPALVLLKISFSVSVLGQPPYEPRFDLSAGFAAFLESLRGLSLDSYALILQDDLYLHALLGSLRVAGLSTALALLIAYPLALAMAHAPRNWRPALILLAVAPFWTSFLIRVYAWIMILKDEGLLNRALAASGLLDAPLRLFATEGAVVIGVAYAYLPFAILPIYNALDRQDRTLVEAARDLGASRLRAFWSVAFPLSLPGVFAGALLVFIPACGEVVIPDLLGGPETWMLGRAIWNDFFANRDWPAASAAAALLLLAILAPLIAFERAQMREEERA
jgi:putrescine transport system permease protein